LRSNWIRRHSTWTFPWDILPPRQFSSRLVHFPSVDKANDGTHTPDPNRPTTRDPGPTDHQRVFLNWHLSVGLLLTLTDLQLSILYTLTVYRFTLLIGAWRWDVKRGGIVCEGECPGEYVRRWICPGGHRIPFVLVGFHSDRLRRNSWFWWRFHHCFLSVRSWLDICLCVHRLALIFLLLA